MNFIATCKCGDTLEFAKHAYRLIIHSSVYPTIIEGKLPCKQYAQTLPDPYKEMLLALTRSKKFAYYFSDAHGVWDLLKGQRVC